MLNISVWGLVIPKYCEIMTDLYLKVWWIFWIYWMPIHYDAIEDGQNKKLHLLFSK